MLRTTEHALKSGALRSFPRTRYSSRTAASGSSSAFSNPRREGGRSRSADKNAGAGRNANPFSPPEKELTVADVTDTHIAVLNKYNVMDHHLLIVTRRFEDQETLLTLRDFEALWLCMAEYDGLGFYNGGAKPVRAAAQAPPDRSPPADPERPGYPSNPAECIGPMSVPGPLPVLPFRHSFVRLRYDMLEKPREAALESFDLYAAMLGSVGMGTPAQPSFRASQCRTAC